MSRFSALLKAMPEALASTYRRFVPNTEDEIIAAIRGAIPQLRNQPYGFTFDPRAGRLLQQGDYGYNMAPVPEQAALNRLAAERVADPTTGELYVDFNEENFLNMLRDPYYMNELRRGANLGGWYDEEAAAAGLDPFVVDPSRRYLSKDRSILAGINANQKAGYDTYVGGAEGEYKLPPLDDAAMRDEVYAEALLSLLARGGAAAGGLYGASRLMGRD